MPFYLEHGTLPPGLPEEIAEALKWLERDAGKQFGNTVDPLLVGVRSGAPISMPGMMDTVLNVGLNDACVHGLAARSGSKRFALDSYKRLLQMFGSVVLEVPKHAFDHALEQVSGSKSKDHGQELSEKELCLG